MWEKKDPYKPQPAEDNSAHGAPTIASDSGQLVNIGKSIVIKGELSGNEALTIDGKVEGKVSLQDHDLTVGKHGQLQAEIIAKRVIILGQVKGNISASERVEILQGGRLEGDIASPRLSISDGAHFRGKVDMDRSTEQKAPAAAVRGQAGAPAVGKAGL
jgi:cytoskeletal protein CcmA (bactofilin family)